MPSWIPAAIAGGAALGGAALNYFGAHQANVSTKGMTTDQMNFQRDSAKTQMDFQERMSNTAYQRAVQDMRLAGINPILAYNQGGASTPSGSAPQGASSRMENVFAGAAHTGLEMARLRTQLEQMRAEVQKTKAETEFTKLLAKGTDYTNVGKQLEAKIDHTTYGAFTRLLGRINPLKGLMKG